MNAAVDGRANLYALGVILYLMLAGRLPFEAHDALEWVHAHVARVPPPLADAAPGVPALLSAVVMKLLAKMPDDRYQAAAGLRHDLARCLEALGARGGVEPFPLGERDRSERLQLPQRLYGRGAGAGARRAVPHPRGRHRPPAPRAVAPARGGAEPLLPRPAPQVFERLQGTCPGLRVLYMSGHAADVIVHRGVVDEGVHLIQKPLTFERLGAKLRRILDR